MSSLREALETAFETEPAPETPTPEVTTEPTEQAAEPVEGRARNEKGQYVAKEPEPVAAVQQIERKAPSSWKPEAQGAFMKYHKGEQLTPEEIGFLAGEAERREGDFHKGLSEFKSHADRARAYDQVIQPYTQYLQGLGTDPTTAIGYLLKTEHTLRTADPVTRANEFAKLAQQYGVDLTQLGEPQQVDPQVQFLMQQLQELRDQQNLWQNKHHEESQTLANQAIEKFKEGRPHFEAVRNDMADLMEINKSLSLEQAYDKAVWMREDIRTTLIDQQRAEAQKKADEQIQAQKAKAAAVSIKGSSPASAGVQPLKGSLRDVIAAQFAD